MWDSLGGINYLLMRGSNPKVGTNVFKALVMTLNPAILEEVVYCCVFFAFCLSMTNSMIESVLSWLISLVLYIWFTNVMKNSGFDLT